MAVLDINSENKKKQFEELIDKLNYRYFTEEPDEDSFYHLFIGKSEWTNQQIKEMGYDIYFFDDDLFELGFYTISGEKTL